MSLNFVNMKRFSAIFLNDSKTQSIVEQFILQILSQRGPDAFSGDFAAPFAQFIGRFLTADENKGIPINHQVFSFIVEENKLVKVGALCIDVETTTEYIIEKTADAESPAPTAQEIKQIEDKKDGTN